MCGPAAMLAVSTAMAASAAYDSSKATKAAYLKNAQYDETRIADTQNRGSEEIFQQRLKEGQIKGTQTASFAARGLSLASGSPFNILMDTNYISGLDVNTIASNTERDAWALREKANANFSSANAINPTFAAATSLIGGASQVAASYYKYNPPAVKTK